MQGMGAAAMVPQTLSMIQSVHRAARARALSAYTAVLSSGFVVGQVVGGALVTANLFGSGWRPVFLVNVPIGLAVLALAPRLVPRDVPSGQRRLDLRGLSVAAPAVFLVVLPLTLGHQERLARLVVRLHGARLRARRRLLRHRAGSCAQAGTRCCGSRCFARLACARGSARSSC